jgi:hypothetical protein
MTITATTTEFEVEIVAASSGRLSLADLEARERQNVEFGLRRLGLDSVLAMASCSAGDRKRPPGRPDARTRRQS